MSYIAIRENGVGRIIFDETPEEITGLAIRGLYTCVGIIIIGDFGMSVIHNEMLLSKQDIEQEFNFVGKIIEWAIFCNPEYLKDTELTNRQTEMGHFMNKYNSTYKVGDYFKFHVTETRDLAISRKDPSVSVVRTVIDSEIRLPNDNDVRNATKNLNSLCAYELKEEISVDIQFDGNEFTNPPKLICDYHQAEHIFNTTRDMWGKTELRKYEEYFNQIYSKEKLLENVGNFSPPREVKEFRKLSSLHHTLSRQYKENKDQNLLIQLYNTTAELCEKCSGESAIGYGEEKDHYLELALESDIKEIKNAAEKIKKDLDETSSDENNDFPL